MKILVIEPHPDDAVLSASHVLSKGNCHVVTLFDNGSSSEGLSSFYEVSTENLHLLPCDERVSVFNWREVKTWENPYVEMIKRHMNDSLFMQRYEEAHPALLESMYNWDYYDCIYYPAGVRHADHVMTRIMVDPFIKQYVKPSCRVFRYYEYPYFNKKYNKVIMSSEVSLDNLKEVPGDPNKVSVFRKVYPQQAATLKWERDIQSLPEYYYEVKL